MVMGNRWQGRALVTLPWTSPRQAICSGPPPLTDPVVHLVFLFLKTLFSPRGHKLGCSV